MVVRYFSAIFGVLCSVIVAAEAAPDCRLRSGVTAAQAVSGICKFEIATLSFSGTPHEQARCLLRPVNKGNKLGDVLAVLPEPFNSLIGKPVDLDIDLIRKNLAGKKIKEAEIGGALTLPLSSGKLPNGTLVPARYFVIHDTSAPNCSNPEHECPVLGKFPPNINEPDFGHNKSFGGLLGTKKAHAVTNRVGQSVTLVDFAEAEWAAKFEACHAPHFENKLGLFIHVENVQPRIGEPAVFGPGVAINDRIAPDPGFTRPQYERLALLYLVASKRRGEWLIPAFHSPIDIYYTDGHDDPQNFSLDEFASALDRLLKAIKAQ